MSLGTGRRTVRSPEVVVALTRSVLVGRAQARAASAAIRQLSRLTRLRAWL